jgi:hypothetical protein
MTRSPATLTFFAVTLGAPGNVALVRRNAPNRLAAMAVGLGMVLARLVLRNA